MRCRTPFRVRELVAIAFLLLASDLTRARAAACASDTGALWAAIPEAERDGVRRDAEGIGAPQVHMVDLDGAPPAEAVFAIDALLGDLHDDAARSLVWVLGCREGRWRTLGRVRLEIDDSWNGTLDERPGVRALRAESIEGVGHALLRVEHVDVRGGYDPRYVRRRFLLLGLVDDRVVVALDTIVREETEAGPDRADGPTTRRYVVYRQTRPASIRFRVVDTTAQGRRRTICQTELRFDGARFVPDDASCFSR